MMTLMPPLCEQWNIFSNKKDLRRVRCIYHLINLEDPLLPVLRLASKL